MRVLPGIVIVRSETMVDKNIDIPESQDEELKSLAQALEQQEEAAEASLEYSRKLKLMVVDDEPDNLDLLYRTFHRDFQVFKADGVRSALEILETEGEMAVIIFDERMKRISFSGEFFTRTVAPFPDPIRIILVGYKDDEDLVELVNSGTVFKYITKPWNPENVRAVVQQAADTYRVVKRRTNELRYELGYKFTQKSREEIAQMLGLSDFRQTRVYQETAQEAKLETVPFMLTLGASVEQIAEGIGLDVQLVRQTAVSHLLASEMSVEQVAEALGLEVEIVRQIEASNAQSDEPIEEV
jgi:response regulator RpfG family c-di-GMP phosphodiesterase